jgi:hypothetical protein
VVLYVVLPASGGKGAFEVVCCGNKYQITYVSFVRGVNGGGRMVQTVAARCVAVSLLLFLTSLWEPG